jgi:hypothetical protein
VRWLAVAALCSMSCTGDILPIQLPGPQFVTEAGNISGAMQEVRPGIEGPLAVGGGVDPILLERLEGGWIPLDVPTDWRGLVRDVAAAQGSVVIAGDHGQVAIGDRAGQRLIATNAGDVSFRSLFARTAADVWIASSGGLFNYDGADVEPIATASISPSQDFFAVWGVGTTVFVAGARGTALIATGTSVDSTETGTTATLRALHGRSRNEVYAVGGDERGAVLRWDGQNWHDIALRSMQPLHTVFAGRAGVWVAGVAGYLARWDGQRWIEIGTGSNAPLTGLLEQEGDLFLTGGNFEDPSASGFIARYGE